MSIDNMCLHHDEMFQYPFYIGNEDIDDENKNISVDASPFTDEALVEMGMIQRNVMEDPETWTNVRKYFKI